VFSTGSLKWNRITDETDRITDRIADKTDRITDENDRVIHAMFVAEFRDKQICDRVGSCRLMRFMWQIIWLRDSGLTAAYSQDRSSSSRITVSSTATRSGL
jgi:hypothetical protein